MRRLFSKSLDAITAEHIASLIQGGARESATVDFKRELPSNSEEHTPKFCALVSALANTGGGRVYYGVDETAGSATALTPLGDTDRDAQERRLTQVLQSNIEPVVPGVRFHWVESEQHGRFMVLDVPRSWGGPHMVKLKKGYRMYSRVGPQNVPLDARGMRQAIVGSEELSQRIRRWRQERLDYLLPLRKRQCGRDMPHLVLHIVPIDAFQNEYRLAAQEILRVHQCVSGKRAFEGFFRNTGGSSRINLDGLYCSAEARGKRYVSAWTQVFRNGNVEMLSMLDPMVVPHADLSGDQHLRLRREYERAVLAALKGALSGLSELGVDSAASIMLTLTNVRGMSMDGEANDGLDRHPIDRHHLDLPDILVERRGTELFTAMRPAFDAVWNACGLPRSLNYDENGTWTAGPVEGLPNP